MKRAREATTCGVCRKPIGVGDPMHMVSYRGYVVVPAHPQCRPPIAKRNDSAAKL
jgi:hypothetical protein